MSFLPSHCLVPLTFEHKKQPRYRAKNRSLKSYDACPRRIKKDDPHASRLKREVLARYNSSASDEPPRPPPRDLVAHHLKRVYPMLDPSDHFALANQSNKWRFLDDGEFSALLGARTQII